MKRFFSVSLAVTLFAKLAPAATSQYYINDGIVTFPPQVDALNFVNNGEFYVTNILDVTIPFYFYNTENITNRGSMISRTSFQLFNSPSTNGIAKASANFVNASAISPTSAQIISHKSMEIWATNVINNGLLDVTTNGLLKITGDNVDLSGGTVAVSGYDPITTNGIVLGNGFSNDPGLFDKYWGIEKNSLAGSLFGASLAFPTFSSSVHLVEELDVNNQLYRTFLQQIEMTNRPNTLFTNRMSDNLFTSFGKSNYTQTIVYMMNSNNAAVPAEIRFDGLWADDDFNQTEMAWWIPVIRWTAVVTNRDTGALTTNHLHLFDWLGPFADSQLLVHTQPSTPSTPSPKPTFMPTNYALVRETAWPFDFLDEGLDFDETIYFSFGSDPDQEVVETGYAAQIEPLSALVYTNIPFASMSNMPGRTEIVANTTLDLTRAKLDCMNYLSLKSTNHFIGSPGSQIIAPFSDIDLSSTNGSLAISDFLKPIPRFRGEIFVWSARFYQEAVSIGGSPPTNRLYFHVLFVDSRLEPTAVPITKDLTLRSRGATDGLNEVVISDAMNVRQSLLIDAEILRVTQTVTNIAGTVVTNATGAINILEPNILWSTSLPRLKYLTNDGNITSASATYFGGARREPFFNSEFDEPYEVLVNRGLISTTANRMWAKRFENRGTILARNGLLSLDAATNAVIASDDPLIPAYFAATNGDVVINSQRLVVSNSLVGAARRLTLSVTNSVVDDTNSPNFWFCGDGMELVRKPLLGDFLGTTVTNKALSFANVINTWTAEDRGADAAGYSDNAAIGRLILDAGLGGSFTFKGTGASQAIYVDYLQLDNHATNYLTSINLTNGVAESNRITLYFANSGPVPPSKLDGIAGGRVRWVTNYVGPNSAMSASLRDGSSIRVGRALLENTEVDSDADGIMNSDDAFPFDGPRLITAVNTTSNDKVVTLSWNAAPKTTYFVDWSTNLASWYVLTNLTSGPSAGVVSVQTAVPGGPSRFYRARYSP